MRSDSGRILLFIGLIATIFLFANNILAKDVPLPTKNIIDNAIDGPQSIVPADIDNDGTLDLVGAATDSGEIAWWGNVNGDGSTWSKTTIDASFTDAEEVDVADVDHDGDLDVLGAGPTVGGTGQLAWWENVDGTGLNWMKHVIDDWSAMSIHSADIDGDGYMDVVGANYVGADIFWWKNVNGTGLVWSFQIITIVSDGSRSVRTADVDNDGDLDVLGVALLVDNISWWENIAGDGTSWTEHRLNDMFDGARSIQAADLDRDGDLDILGGAQLEGRIAWWENNRSDPSTWVEYTITSSFVGVRSVYPVDLDQDGDLDVVGAAFESNTVAWWENVTGDASTWTEHVLDNNFGNAISVTVADIDSDGDPDVLAAAELDDTIAWWENETIHGEAIYPHEFTHTISDSVDGSVWSEAVDIDKDGDLDVLATGYNEGSVSWFENTDGNALVWNQYIVSQRTDIVHRPYMVHHADIDRDGDLDLASVSISSSELSWYENVDGIAQSWITHTLATDVSTARHLAIADLDQDGDDDLIATDTSNTHSLRWWENQNGATLWTEHLIFATTQGMRPINAADIDDDGDLDLISGTAASLEVYWFENLDGVGTTWANHLIDTNFLHSSYLDPVDLDRDGDIDILGTGWLQDEVVWWENNTNGANWTKHVIDSAFDYADTVRAFDIDRDGDLDALVTSLGDDAVDEFAWWENVAGDASTWTKHLLDFGDNATSIEAADFDRDGDLDILGAAFNDDSVLWWENRGGQFSLPTTDTAPSGINAGNQDDLLQIVATHNGRSGDNPIELTTFELLLEESADDPLTNAEANAIIENLHVYLDDGSGVFEEENDTWVTAVDTLQLADGIQTVQFADDDLDVSFGWQAPSTYFVVMELNFDLVDDPNRNGVSTLRLTHITEASSTAQDQLFNIPLSLTYTPNVSAQIDLLSPTVVSLQRIGIRETDVSFWLITIVFFSFILISGYIYHRSNKRA